MNSLRRNDEPKEDDEISKRAKARWAILRNALLKNNIKKQVRSKAHSSIVSKTGKIEDDKDNDIGTYSIHRFEGFQVFNRTVIDKENTKDCHSVLLHDSDGNNYEIVEYEIPTRKSNHMIGSNYNEHFIVKIRTREKIRQGVQQKVNIKDLMSHVYYGVDNTGNTCVWECSSILAYLVTSCPSPLSTTMNQLDFHGHPPPFIGLSNILSLSRQCQKDFDDTTINRLRVIELGAGMASLPSLSLAAVALNNEITESNDVPFMDIVITDGHPRSIENNLACSKLTTELYGMIDKDEANNPNKCYSIRTHQLLWKANDEGMKECQEILKVGNHNEEDDYFDLVLVSDCTHFTAFHDGLICTIGRLLRVNGYCLLCQPKRGLTLDQFIQMIHVINDGVQMENDSNDSNDSKLLGPLFDLNLYHDYDDGITKKHQTYSEIKHQGYDENIHYPIILILKKLRKFNEDVDTALATKHSRDRNNDVINNVN